MNSKTITIHKTVAGEVQSNDGRFANIQTDGVYGAEEGILFLTIEIQRDETETTPCTSDDFRRRFPVGTEVRICTNTEITNDIGHTSTRSAVHPTNPYWTNPSRLTEGDPKTSFRLVDDIKEKLGRRFPALIDELEPEHPWLSVGVVLISVEILRTIDIDRLAAFTGFSKNFVGAIAVNLMQSDLWSGGGRVRRSRTWLSPEYGSISARNRLVC